MLMDSLYVMVKGKFIGPSGPGPWSFIFSRMHLNVFHSGPLFILFGTCWVVFFCSIWKGYPWARTLGIILSLITLWYLPYGTFISVIILLVCCFRYY